MPLKFAEHLLPWVEESPANKGKLSSTSFLNRKVVKQPYETGYVLVPMLNGDEH